MSVDECRSALYALKAFTDMEGIYGGHFSSADFQCCCLAIIDSAYKESIVETVIRVYLRDVPHLKETYPVHICGSADEANFDKKFKKELKNMVSERTLLTGQIDRQKELENCTFVKTILMLMILVYHSILFFGGNWFTQNPVYESKVLGTLAEWLNSFHIYAFVLVSGYIYYYLKFNCGKYNKTLLFIKNKVKRLLIPYFFVAIIWVVPIQYAFFQYDLTTILKNFLLAISPNQLWFLFMLFGVFCVFSIISNYSRNHDVESGLLVIAFWGVGIIGVVILPNVFQIWRACTYIPFFWIGFKICQHGSQLIRKIPCVIWLIIDVALFIATKYFSTIDGIVFKLMNVGFTFILHVVGAIMAFVVLQKLANTKKWKESRTISLLSRNSMPIYLFHQQVIYFTVHWLNGVVNPYLHSVVNITIALVVSLIISILLMKFKWTRLLLGEK